MVDVFVSYKREERERCEYIVRRLRALELDVWFDARLTSGMSFDREIETTLRDAKVVLVLWSPRSVESEWYEMRPRLEKRGKNSQLCKLRYANFPSLSPRLTTRPSTSRILGTTIRVGTSC